MSSGRTDDGPTDAHKNGRASREDGELGPTKESCGSDEERIDVELRTPTIPAAEF